MRVEPKPDCTQACKDIKMAPIDGGTEGQALCDAAFFEEAIFYWLGMCGAEGLVCCLQTCLHVLSRVGNSRQS